jgi:hypothetical protein
MITQVSPDRLAGIGWPWGELPPRPRVWPPKDPVWRLAAPSEDERQEVAA